ncbi:hypothetical protein [Yoonia sp.]|uniref:hypothetical protein n=1 Tax=Yoonia sp. TaxID=2212373 RepID=UPI002E0A9B2E|nr:hypothetical protein [Yoonia sp.]
MFKFKSDRAAVILATCLSAAPVLAQDAQGAHISIELNAVEPVEDACRISFLVQNGHSIDIEQAVYEAVLFDTQGRVDRLTLFDFGALPAARPRVRQFVVPGLACASLGSLLINGAETCAGDNLPAGACSTGLALDSRTDVEVLG